MTKIQIPPMKVVESSILNPVFHEDAYFDKTPLEKQRVCCNCKHRTKPYRCDIDEHFISYLACFTAWCRRWKKEKE